MDQISGATRSLTAGDMMNTRFAAVSPGSSLAEVRKKLGQAVVVAVLGPKGVLLGLIGRADLPALAPEPPPDAGQLGGVAELIMGFIGHAAPPASAAAPGMAASVVTPMTADGLRSLVATSEQRHADAEKAIVAAAEAGRREQVKIMQATHVEAPLWDGLLAKARLAAEHGAHDFELLRFPAGLCSDGARKINNAEEDWPATLSGEAAEMYGRWNRELKPAGFGLSAEVLDYPRGLPGDVSLVLTWQH